MNNPNLSIGKLMSESRYSNSKNNSKLTDKEHALNIGKRLFEYYDKDKSKSIEDYEIENMMFDIYNSMGIDFMPSKEDINGFREILDADRDGNISINDIQHLIVKYIAN